MHDGSSGFWAVALGAATASGTWEGFRISPVGRTAELHVDGALTVGAEQPRAAASGGDYALVLSHPALARDRVLVAGRGGTVEFGHDVVELLGERAADGFAELWLTDLATGAASGRCELPRLPEGMRAKPGASAP